MLVYDCRGHGALRQARRPLPGREFADDLAELLDHVGWRSAVVAGASMGGCITLAFAAAYPERGRRARPVRHHRLVRCPRQMGGARRAPPRPRVSRRCSSSRPRAGSPMPSARAARTCSTTASPSSSPTPAEAYAETCRMLGACNMTAALPQLSMPVAHRGRRRGLCDAGRDGADAASRHRGLDADGDPQRAPSHAARMPAADRRRARELIEAVPAQ